MALLMDTDIVLDALCLAVYSDTEETKAILREICKIYKETKTKVASGDKDLDIFFEIINDAIRTGIDPTKKSEKSQIILKVKKSDLGKSDKTIIDSVVDILSEDPKTIKETKILALQRRLQQYIFIYKAKDKSRRISMKCQEFNPSDDVMNDAIISDVLNYANEIATMEQHMMGMAETIDEVDMTDPKSVSGSLQAFTKKRIDGVFKTGLKQLNRMLCPNYGFLRGEFGAFAASSHNFKTGMLLKMARWCCTRSVVKVSDGLKPIVVFISLENEVPDNTFDLIKAAYIDIYRQPIPENANQDELIKKIAEYYYSKQIKLIIYRYDENFTFLDFVKLIESKKKQGYCVVAAIIDYITLMKLEGDDKDNQAARFKRLGIHFKNYAKRNDMFICTGLQLNGLADELNSMKKTNTVRLYNPVHLSDCKGLVNELDILIFMKIETNQDDIPYLTGAWYKHRGGDRPPKECMSFAYRFHPLLGIPEDEDTEYDYHKPDIYSDNMLDEGTEQSELFAAVAQNIGESTENAGAPPTPTAEFKFG